jgi:hypothetical protein
MLTMKTLKSARLALAGAIIGAALVNIVAHTLGFDGSHHAIGAVAGGVLTAALIKAAHIV